MQTISKMKGLMVDTLVVDIEGIEAGNVDMGDVGEEGTIVEVEEEVDSIGVREVRSRSGVDSRQGEEDIVDEGREVSGMEVDGSLDERAMDSRIDG